MGLPKIKTPTFITSILSTNQQIKYRPFTVGEEKILLIAGQSDNPQEISNAVMQILTNCIIDDVDVGSLTPYDIEYLMLQLRAKSVNNVAEIMITDEEDKKQYKTEVDLDSVKINRPDREMTFELGDHVIELRDPTYERVQKIAMAQDENEGLLLLLSAAIAKVFADDEVHVLDEYTWNEQVEFLNSIPTQGVAKIQKFFADQPKVSAEVKYTREDGKAVVREVDGLMNFFTS